MEALIEGTGLRTAENVVRGIDPRIVEQALQNGALDGAATAELAARRDRLEARSLAAPIW